MIAIADFQKLVEAATRRLNDDAKNREAYYISRGAHKLEDDVFRAMCDCAIGTIFADKIEKISGQRFPDIVVAKQFGLEVKSSKDKWLSLGGSVNESTRVDGVEYVMMIFGKLVSPVEFISRPYEDCLSEVVATHYPRYKIDMKLPQGETIFHKMRTTYDELRGENAVYEVMKYYKENLRDGETLWWVDGANEEENVTATMTVRMWSTLTADEQDNLKVAMFVLFPEIIAGNPRKKYERAVLWLASRHGVVNPSFRDIFSAGGKVDSASRIFNHVKNFSHKIHNKILSTEAETLMESWNVQNLQRDRLSQWLVLAANRQSQTAEILHKIFGR